MKKIAILGSTGSIGTQTIDVIRLHREDFEITALGAGRNIAILETQIREFHPSVVSVASQEDAEKLRVMTADLDLEICSGMDGLLAVATQKDSQMLVTGIVGMMGIRPTIAAIEAGKDIALANKETLVAAGHIIMPLAKKHGVRILPVDSEHSAIFQSYHGEKAYDNPIEKIYLTASGGAFRGKTRDELTHVSINDALKNPNWIMGKKVTIDSATLINKGEEVIEAVWLFGVSPSQIQILIHPQSVIHSMVQYEDGAVLAQLSVPDMRLPIQYALYYPKRRNLNIERLDLSRLARLDFEEPDTETFPGPLLARQAIERGGNIPAAFNAANERAVALFLDDRIPFLSITDVIQYAMEECAYRESPDVDGILETEREVAELIEGRW